MRSSNLSCGNKILIERVSRGESLHNRHINKTGVVLDGSDKTSIKVMTISGKLYWNISECDVINNLD